MLSRKLGPEEIKHLSMMVLDKLMFTKTDQIDILCKEVLDAYLHSEKFFNSLNEEFVNANVPKAEAF